MGGRHTANKTDILHLFIIAGKQIKNSQQITNNKGKGQVETTTSSRRTMQSTEREKRGKKRKLCSNK